MTPQEFMAWFEGFTEAFDRIPTKAQWARVKERVAEIDGKPVTERIYLDRYWPQYVPVYGRPYWAAYGSGLSAAGICNNSASARYANATNNMSQQSAQGSAYNSGQAMLALGRADAKALDS